MTGQIFLRDVEEGDLPELFAHQCDPVASEMAAHPAREFEAFMDHWSKILNDDGVIKRTILIETEIAGGS